VVPQVILISLGVLFVIDKLSRRGRIFSISFLGAIIFYSVLQLYSSVIILNEYYRASEWDYGLQEVSSYIKDFYQDIPIVFDNSRDEMYIQLAFFLKYQPRLYQQENFEVKPEDYYTQMERVNQKNIGKIVTRPINWDLDLKIEQLGGLNYLRIKPRRESLARYGVNILDINQVTEILSSGYMAGSVFEGNKRFDITIKTNREIHFNLEEIRSLPVKSSSGISIPLGDLADVYIESGPVQVSHQNQYRRMIVEFNVRGRDMMSVVNEANELLAKNVPLPVGYRFEFGGKYENYISARNTLMVVVPLTLCLILFLLWLANLVHVL
jgi:hypothetical protein